MSENIRIYQLLSVAFEQICRPFQTARISSSLMRSWGPASILLITSVKLAIEATFTARLHTHVGGSWTWNARWDAEYEAVQRRISDHREIWWSWALRLLRWRLETYRFISKASSRSVRIVNFMSLRISELIFCPSFDAMLLMNFSSCGESNEWFRYICSAAFWPRWLLLHPAAAQLQPLSSLLVTSFRGMRWLYQPSPRPD